VYVLDALKRQRRGQAQIMGFRIKRCGSGWSRSDGVARDRPPTSPTRSAAEPTFGAGQIGQQPNAGPVELTFPVVTQGQYTDPRQYLNIILRANQDGSAIVRLAISPARRSV
jgi:multidrug efflux pump